MPTVNVASGQENTHDISLSDGSTTYGLIFARGGIRVLNEVPLSPPASPFSIEQENWIGGRGRVKYTDDPTGYNDGNALWATTEGKLFPSLQWRFGDGIRSHTTYLPAANQTYAWWKLYGSTPASQLTRYLSVTFTPSASYTATGIYVWIRRRGTPGTLTLELCSNTAGDPGSVLQTITKTTSDVTDTLAIYLKFSTSQALTGSTVYHLKIYGAGTDSSTDHWEVLTNDDGSSSKYSTDNSAWSAANVTMYYRVTDADTRRQWFVFQFDGGTYAVSKNDGGSASKLYINGVRGTATSGASTTLTDTNLSMATNVYAGALIRILDGTGDGQIRTISSNTATAFTVSSAWSVNPSTDSRYVVYDTDYWTEITSTSLGVVTGPPAVSSKVCYFPQGQSDPIRRMRVNASSHEFADDGTNYADLMFVHADGLAPKVYSAHIRNSTIIYSDVKAWGTNLAFGTTYNIGTSDYRINNMKSHNKLLHIFKEDGLYTFSNNIIEKMGGTFDDIPDPNTGFGAAVKDNVLWFGWAHSVVRMIGASVNDMLNWKAGYEGTGTSKRSNVDSLVSAVGWLFMAMRGDDSNYPVIWLWNNLGWHEIFQGWAVTTLIRNMSWQPNINGRSRLWFDVDGDLAYIAFPQWSANPLKDTTLNYGPEGTIVTATYDARDQHLYKILANLRMYVKQGSCEVDYQTNANVGTGNWTVLGTASTSPSTDLTLDVGGVLQVRFRIRLQSAHSYTPCILEGWQLTGRMMPVAKYQWMGTFRADTEAETFLDEPDVNPNTLYTQLQTWAQNQTKLTLRSSSSSADNKVVTVSMPSKSVDWVDELGNWGGRISFAMLET